MEISSKKLRKFFVGILSFVARLRRGGSRGFILQEESVDEELLKDSLVQEQRWIDKFKHRHTGMLRKDTSESSKYSFSTEYRYERVLEFLFFLSYFF